jgi:hypothetical protein
MSSLYHVLDYAAGCLSNWLYPKPIESPQTYDTLKQQLINAGLLEERQNVTIFRDPERGRVLHFVGSDRGERLKNYLEREYADQLSPSGNDSSPVERTMMGLLGITVLTNAVIAPAMLALEKLQVFEKIRKMSQVGDLPCHVGLIAGGLCSISNKNRESCLVLQLLACLGKAQADLFVKHPVYNKTINVGQPANFLIDQADIFSDPFVTITATQTGVNSLPYWLTLSQQIKEPVIIGSIATTDSRDIHVNGNYAYVAD